MPMPIAAFGREGPRRNYSHIMAAGPSQLAQLADPKGGDPEGAADVQVLEDVDALLAVHAPAASHGCPAPRGGGRAEGRGRAIPFWHVPLLYVLVIRVRVGGDPEGAADVYLYQYYVQRIMSAVPRADAMKGRTTEGPVPLRTWR